MLAGVLIGRSIGPPPVAFPEPDEARDADAVRASVDEALDEPRAFPRAGRLIRIFEGLTPANAKGAAESISARSGRWDPVDLQLFLSAWALVDPLAAVREVESWPIRSRREIGLTIAMREWAASGGGIDAAAYFQSIRDPDTRAMAAGPLVRGWALSGDVQGALTLAHRLWHGQGQLDVVDGFVRGALLARGAEDVLALARAVEPNRRGAFEQRLARVALNLAGREDPQAAARLYAALLRESVSSEDAVEGGEEAGAGAERGAWLGGMLDRVAGLWRNQDARAALVWILTETADAPQAERLRALSETMSTWALRDPDAAVAWFETERGALDATGALDPVDSALVAGLVRARSRAQPAQAGRWAARIGEGVEGVDRLALMARVARLWARQDPEATLAWLEDLPRLDERQRARLRRAAERGARAGEPDPDESASDPMS